MNHNAVLKEQTQQQHVQDHASLSARHFDELSSSGIESDWILFSPHTDDIEPHGDVLSNSTDNARRHSLQNDFQDDEVSEESDLEDDDDDDSLIESLGTNIHLSLPTHDGTGSFVSPSHATGSSPDVEDYDYLQSLQKEDFVAHRIDTWRKEQAKVMINDLHRHSLTSSSATEKTTDLLASWGVDDRLLAGTDFVDEEHEQKQRNNNKRFYGDDILQGYSKWEITKVKRVAHQLSSSLTRDSQHAHHLATTPLTTTFRARRSSLLLNLSRSANKYFIDRAALLNSQPFWKQDLSSAHSSLSLSTNSIMFGNLNIEA